MRVKKSWGYEQFISNGTYCMKLLVYTKRIASSLHYHPVKEESFYVASGEFELELNGMLMHMLPGDYIGILPGTPHRLRCFKPGTIVEASTHDDPEDCIRLIPSES